MDEGTSSVDTMTLNELKNLLSEFGKNVSFEHDLKKKTGLILEEKPKYFLKQIILKIYQIF